MHIDRTRTSSLLLPWRQHKLFVPRPELPPHPSFLHCHRHQRLYPSECPHGAAGARGNEQWKACLWPMRGQQLVGGRSQAMVATLTLLLLDFTHCSGQLSVTGSRGQEREAGRCPLPRSGCGSDLTYLVAVEAPLHLSASVFHLQNIQNCWPMWLYMNKCVHECKCVGVSVCVNVNVCLCVLIHSGSCNKMPETESFTNNIN